MESLSSTQALEPPVLERRKVLAVADLHQRPHLYSQLATVVSEHQPDVVALVGDFLEAEAPPDVELLTVEEAAAALLALPCAVVMVRGEQEREGWPAFETAWRASGRELHALHGSVVTLAGVTFAGFPCLIGDASFYSKGRELPGACYDDWFSGVFQEAGLASRWMVWLMHEPPCPELAAVPCEEWGRAIRDYLPMQVVSGHDHVHTLTGPNGCALGWLANMGDTMVANFGQRVDNPRGKLLYGILDFEGKPGGLMMSTDITRYGSPRHDEPPLGW